MSKILTPEEVETVTTKIEVDDKPPKNPEAGSQPDATDKTYTQKELDAIIQSKITEAVTSEKNKLYGTISQKEKEKSEIENELSEFRQKEAEAKAEAEKERIAKLTLEERIEEMSKQTGDQIGRLQEIIDLNQKETDLKLKKKDLDLHREKLLGQAGGEVIPGLVRGNSIEELNASYEQSKSEYARIVAARQEQIESQANQEAVNIASKEVPSSSDTTVNPAQEKTRSELQAMDPEEFRRYKENLLSRLDIP